MVKKKFKRRELKFKLSFEEYESITKKINFYMLKDEYGLHKISSLYFDTEDFQFTQDSIKHKAYKEKFRVRFYNEYEPEKPVFLEIKRKYQGLTDKRRIVIPGNKYEYYINSIKDSNYDSGDLAGEHIHDEIQWMFRRLELVPKVIVIYDRLAYIDPNNEGFRITFDFNILYRTDYLDIKHEPTGNLIEPELDVLMEVKYEHSLPEWFSKIIEELKLEKQSFSKYKEVYNRYIKNRKFVMDSV